jgi:D-sedoheptulose 7-phosphate isomerase
MPNLTEPIQRSLASSRDVLAAFVADPANTLAMDAMSAALADCFRKGGKVLACGNGGSACDALHFAEELTGRFKGDRRALPAIPLLEGANITCIANDYGFESIFSRGVEAYGKPGDILLAISTSGNSPNVIKAVEAARKQGLVVHLLLGKDGGKLLGKGDAEIRVKSPDTERIQEVHMVVLHILIESLERRLFPENYEE